MPVPVDDVIASFTQPWTKVFDCPPGSKMTKVTVNVTTRLVAWDPALAEKDSEGTYHWGLDWQWVGTEKTITATNWVMLDPRVTQRDENNEPEGPRADEGLLYHELLHGQLLIDAMKTPAWLAKACNCEIDDGPADWKHAQIPGHVDGYLGKRAEGQADEVKTVEPDPQRADSRGNFDIDLGPTEQIAWERYYTLEPTGGSNVDEGSITVGVVGGHFHVKGKLIDNTREGKFLIRIVAFGEWIFGGLENAMVVLPLAVGGAGEIPVSQGGSEASAGSPQGPGASAPPYAVIAGGAAAAALAIVAGGWYARRHWLR
jgi:hypothetical protein